MSSFCGYDLEDFIAYNHDLKVEGRDDANESLKIAEILGVYTKRSTLTAEQFPKVVALYEPYREDIEYLLSEFCEEQQSWRDYSFAVLHCFPSAVVDEANKVITKLMEV